MISRIKPEHQSPIEQCRWIAGTLILEKSPHIWNWSDYSIMDMCWGLCSVAALAKGANLLLRADKPAGFSIYCMQMQVHMEPPFRTKNHYSVARLATIFSGKENYTSGL